MTMNEELRAAFDKLDRALAEARAALEKPKTITVTKLDKRYRDCFSAVSSITAVWHNVEGPCLRIVSDAIPGAPTLTKMDLADIIAQAEAAEIELPEVTVRIDDVEWTSIDEIAHTADGKTQFWGEFDGREPSHHSTAITPAQVLALCRLAGWPKPEVTMVCTYADGDPCEVDPENIFGVGVARHATTIETNTPLADGFCVRFVREPVPVVQAMLAACKEGE
jgi:hypothetical protein